MSEPAVLLLGPAIDAGESATSLERLGSLSLPNSTSYVVTTGKFDTRKLAKTFNVEAGYPGEVTVLQTFAAWAEIPYRTDARFRDGYDLFCLRSLLAKVDSFDYAVLVRNATSLQERWPELLTELQERLFVVLGSGSPTSGSPSLVLNLADPRISPFLECAIELYLTGAVYGIPRYSLAEALITAARSAETERAISQHRSIAA